MILWRNSKSPALKPKYTPVPHKKIFITPQNAFVIRKKPWLWVISSVTVILQGSASWMLYVGWIVTQVKRLRVCMCVYAFFCVCADKFWLKTIIARTFWSVLTAVWGLRIAEGIIASLQLMLDACVCFHLSWNNSEETTCYPQISLSPPLQPSISKENRQNASWEKKKSVHLYKCFPLGLVIVLHQTYLTNECMMKTDLKLCNFKFESSDRVSCWQSRISL